MVFLFIIIALIVFSIGIYFLIQKIVFPESNQVPYVKVETYRVKGTARGAIGRLETTEMLESKRKKVNGVGSKF